MKKTIQKLFLAASAVCALFAASCSFLHDDSSTDSVSGKNPTVTLSVSSLGRTALPAVDLTNITEFTLTGEPTSGDLSKTWTDKNGITHNSSSGITWKADSSGGTDVSPANANAYATMIADEIGMAAGEWTFTLTGVRSSGYGDNATYIGTATQTIGANQNKISFDLALSTITAGTGIGALSVTVGFNAAVTAQLLTAKLYKAVSSYDANGILSGKNLYGVTLTGTSTTSGWTGTGSAGTTAYLTESDASSSEITLASAASSFTTENLYTFSVSGLSAGEYYAVFTFYDDANKTNVLAAWKEAAYVTALGAQTSLMVDSLDSTYPIVYLELVDQVPTALQEGETATPFAAKPLGTVTQASTINQLSYSRHSAFTLGDPSVSQNYTFWRWVEVNVSSVTGSNADAVYNVTFNEAKTSHTAGQIGPKYYMAQFFSAEAYKQIDHITLTDASTAVSGSGVTEETAVGHTVTATAYTNTIETADSAETAFKADVTWTWQCADAADAETWETISADITNVTEGTIARTSSLMIRPAYVGKYIRASAVQTYKVTVNSNGTEVTRNDTTSLENAVSGTTAQTVANGTLELSGVTLTYTPVAVIGSQLLVSGFTITAGTVRDAVATSWTYADSTSANTFTDSSTVRLTTTATAPYSSGPTALPLTFSVAGYNELVYTPDWTAETERPTATGANVVNVTVQAKAPVLTRSDSDTVSEQLLVSLMDKNLVTYNKIRFTTVSPTETTVTVDSGKYPTALVPALEYSFDNEAWSLWKTTEDPDGSSATANYLVQEIDAAGSSAVHVRTRGCGTSGQTGYVAPSERVTITLSNSDTSILGTLVRLKEVTIDTPTVSRSSIDITTGDTLGGTSPKVGSTTTVTLVPEIAGQNVKATSLVYTWKIGESVVRTVTKSSGEAGFYTDSYELASAHNNLTVYNGVASNDSEAGNAYIITDATAGSTLSVTVTPTYQTATQGDTAPEATRTASNADPENAKSISDTIALGTLQFSNNFALSYTAQATKVIRGTKPAESYVGVTGSVTDSVTGNANTIAQGTAGFTSGLYHIDYSFDDTTVIGIATPLRFTATGFNAAVVNIDTSSLLMEPAEVAATLLSTEKAKIPLGSILFKDSTDYKYYMFEYCTNTSAGSPVWLPVPSTPFSTDGTYYSDVNEYFTNAVSLRFKATYTDEAGNVFYYNSYANATSGTAAWESYQNVTVPDGLETASTSASAPIELDLTEGDYIGGHCALVTVSIANDNDLDLQLVTSNFIFLNNGEAYENVRWYLDGALKKSGDEEYAYQVTERHTGTGTGKYIVTCIATRKATGDDLSASVTYTYTVR